MTFKNKKFFQVFRDSIRFLYEDGYGTTLRFSDELYYISICVVETIGLIGIHFGKKFFGAGKNRLRNFIWERDYEYNRVKE